MKDAFGQLMRESDKAVPVPESIAKYAAALVAGTHEITSLTIRPKRTWVGLTDKEIEAIWEVAMFANYGVGAELSNQPFVHYARAIEAKLKEKNT